MDKQLFDDAIGEVPPSTVDVDAAIALGRRAARLRHVANPAVAAGVAVVLLTGAVAYTMTRGGDGGTTVGTAPPASTTSSTSPTSPTSQPRTSGPEAPSSVNVGADAVPPPQCAEDDQETVAEAKSRLTAAATEAVLAQRPDLQLSPNPKADFSGTPRGALEFFQIAGDTGTELPVCDPSAHFEAAATTHSHEGAGNILFSMSPDWFPDQTVSCDGYELPGATACTDSMGPDGELVKQTVGFEGSTVMHRVQVVRPDGTALLVQAENIATTSKMGGEATATAPPLTLDQLAAIATDPDLGIFP